MTNGSDENWGGIFQQYENCDESINTLRKLTETLLISEASSQSSEVDKKQAKLLSQLTKNLQRTLAQICETLERQAGIENSLDENANGEITNNIISDISIANEEDNDKSIIIIKGAGVKAVNGIYKSNGFNDGVRKYIKKSLYRGKEETFMVFRCSLTKSNKKKSWFISIVPKNQTLGTSKDLDFYSCPIYGNRHDDLPPKRRWVIDTHGAEPVPHCLWKEFDNRIPQSTSEQPKTNEDNMEEVSSEKMETEKLNTDHHETEQASTKQTEIEQAIDEKANTEQTETDQVETEQVETEQINSEETLNE